MKKIVKISTIAVATIIMGMTSISTNQSNKSIKRDGLKFTKINLGMNKAFAATSTERQMIYDAAKREVNTELAAVITAVNKLLDSAKITSCSSIPASSATAFFTNSENDLYSSAVGSQTWPIGTVSGVIFDKRMDLTAKDSKDILGSLWVDCDSGAAMVKYIGKSRGVSGDDTDILIAYHDDSSTGLESILMFSDYKAGSGYSAGKMAIHYIEGSSSLTVNFAYKDADYSLSGTVNADTAGKVTGGTDVDVTSGQVVNDLRALTGSSTIDYSAAKIGAFSIPTNDTVASSLF